MSDIVALLTGVVGIAEVIIQATKEKVRAKIPAEIWASIVLGVVGAFGIAFDVVFNCPIVNGKYILTVAGFMALVILVPHTSYDTVILIIEKVKKMMKK